MSIRSLDIVLLSELRNPPGRVVKHDAEEEREFMRAVVEGIGDLESGRDVSLTEAQERLGLT